MIAKTKSQMEAEKKAKAQEEAKRAEEIAAAVAQEQSFEEVLAEAKAQFEAIGA